jgi:hypothetical protein
LLGISWVIVCPNEVTVAGQLKDEGMIKTLEIPFVFPCPLGKLFELEMEF